MISVAAAYAVAEIAMHVFKAWLEPLAQLTAAAVQAIVAATGTTVLRVGTVLSHAAGFACEIDVRCLGLGPILIFAALLAAERVLDGRYSPASDPRRLSTRRVLAYCVAGGVLLTALNLVRLATLFHVGVAAPEYFAPAHDVVWPMIIFVVLLVMWRAALRGAPRPRSNPAPGLLPRARAGAHHA